MLPLPTSSRASSFTCSPHDNPTTKACLPERRISSENGRKRSSRSRLSLWDFSSFQSRREPIGGSLGGWRLRFDSVPVTWPPHSKRLTGFPKPRFGPNWSQKPKPNPLGLVIPANHQVQETQCVWRCPPACPPHGWTAVGSQIPSPPSNSSHGFSRGKSIVISEVLGDSVSQ